MLHMGYLSPSVIALVYDFSSLYKKIDSIQWHTGEDMIVFVSESTRLVYWLYYLNHCKYTRMSIYFQIDTYIMEYNN